LTVIFVGR